MISDTTNSDTCDYNMTIFNTSIITMFRDLHVSVIGWEKNMMQMSSAQTLDTARVTNSSVDGEFLEKLKQYIDSGVHNDAQEVEGGSEHPLTLSNMLISLTAKLNQ